MNDRLTRLRLGVKIALMLGVIALAADAQTPRPDYQNAATWYRRAIEQFQRLPDADKSLLMNFAAGSDLRPSAELRDALARVRPALELLDRGTQAQRADFELDLSRGFELLLPHVSPLRGMVRCSQADAMVRVLDGDAAGAAQRLSLINQVAGDLTHDGLMISSLVSAAIIRGGDSTLQYGLDRGAFAAEEAGRVLESLEQLDAFDPAGMADAIESERVHFVGGFMDQLDDEDGLNQFRKSFVDTLMIGEELSGRQQKFLEASPDELRDSLKATDALYGRAVAAFGMEDPDAARAELDKISAEIERGEHGIVSQMVVPAFGRVFETMILTRDLVANRKAELRKLASGEIQSGALMNAALEYFAAIDAIDALPEATLAPLRDVAANKALPLEPDALQAAMDALDEVQEILTILQRASMRTRCDFTVSHEIRPALLLRHACGLREAVRLLHADAAHRDLLGDRAILRDRLDACFRISAHLAGDKAVISALTAQDIFSSTSELLHYQISKDALSESDRMTLFGAAERSKSSDPFGYAAALEIERIAIRRLLRGAGAADESGDQWVDQYLQSLTADDVPALTAIAEAMRPPQRDVQRDLQRETARLAGVIDVEKLFAARELAAQVTSTVTSRNAELIESIDWPQLAPLRDRQMQAHRTISQTLRWLTPLPPPESSRPPSPPSLGNR